METHIWIFILIGILGMLLPWLKSLEKVRFLNVPLVAILLGMCIYLLPIELPDPDPIKHQAEWLRITEIAVIISLMGAGLSINRNFGLKAYRVPLLLVLITMIGSIAAVAVLGWWFGLVPASALLLGAVFAPTDPVLASDVQVKLEETAEEEHPVKFSLTAEAGLNDGMAFPFTWLAIWVALYGLNYEEWFSTWLLKDVLYRIVGGLVIGFGMGRLMALLFLVFPKKLKLKPRPMGLMVLAITFFVYGLTEAVQAYGFIAVFVSALTLRHFEKEHDLHKHMHDVVEQLEQFLTVIILILLGGYLAHHWFENVSAPMVALCLLLIFVIRPLLGIIPTLGTDMPWRHRWIVAFMGIKGVGSFFYLAFALHEAEFAQAETLWGTAAFLVLASIVIHGIAGNFAKRKFLR